MHFQALVMQRRGSSHQTQAQRYYEGCWSPCLQKMQLGQFISESLVFFLLRETPSRGVTLGTRLPAALTFLIRASRLTRVLSCATKGILHKLIRNFKCPTSSQNGAISD